MLNTRNILLLSLFYFFGFNITLWAQNKEIPLWETIPNAITNDGYKETFRLDKKGVVNAVRNVKTPTLKLFLANNSKTDNTAVVICPGGGYSVLSHIKEGDKIAEWFNSIGISAFVLKYRLPSDIIMKDKTIGPLQDAQEAMRMVRRHAKEWNINPNKVGVIGFSAGGHLASTLSTHYNDKVYPITSNTVSARPNFSILIYPVISMEDGITHNGSKANLLGDNPTKASIYKYSNEKQVNKNTPPTILVHSTDDKAVPVENSINYYLALKQHKVPAEIHIYENGGHGYGLGRFGTHLNWTKACEDWLIANRFILEK